MCEKLILYGNVRWQLKLFAFNYTAQGRSILFELVGVILKHTNKRRGRPFQLWLLAK
jgi:hypothetical protein